MKVSDFDFDLPAELIAQVPARPRDAARLLAVAADGGLTDRAIADLPNLLRPGDLLVVNDTRVIPARLRGKRGTAGVEVTLHKRMSADAWRAFARPARKLRSGDKIVFAEGFSADVTEKGTDGEVTLRFSLAGDALDAAIARRGFMPLPPYIKRPAGGTAVDGEDYQTAFAVRPGAVAAPTAGLHFTPRLLAALDARGIGRAAVTLHVGAGTFLPVKVEDVADHRMYAEWGEVAAAAADAIDATRARGGRVVAVGSTALRLIETAAGDDGAVRPFAGETALFIVPGYRFKAVDLMLTNFHLPRSTLFMLVSAFAGLETMKRAYAHAIAERYRFFSYGDACLLEKGPAA